MLTIVDKIKNDIYKQKRGFVFTKYRFFDLGNPKTIAKVLERMVESGEIRRIARGIYDYPKKHPEFGEPLSKPGLESGFDSITKRYAIFILFAR